jgi:hypothetical protein
MKLRVKQGLMAYRNDRRYRQGEVVDVPEKSLRKADQAYLDALEVQRAKELGRDEAKKHGLKVGSLILPKWAELANKPAAPEPGLPGTGRQPGVTPKDEEAASEGKEQEVL